MIADGASMHEFLKSVFGGVVGIELFGHARN